MLIDIQNNAVETNWATLVRTLLEYMGFADVLINHGVGKIKYFLHIFKLRAKDCFMQKWNEELRESTRASTYYLLTLVISHI